MISQDQPLTLKRLLGQARRWLPFILLTCAVTAGVAFLMTRDRAPEYQAAATLLIGIADQQPNRNDAVNAGQGLARTYARIFGDPQLYERAASELAIPGLSAGQLQNSVKVYAVSGTPLIDIEVTRPNGDEAILIANHMAQLFVEQRRQQSLAGLQPFIDQTAEQRAVIEQELSTIRPANYDSPEALGLRKEQEQLIIREQALQSQAAEIAKQIDVAAPASTSYKIGVASSQLILIATLIGATVAFALAILAELLMPTLMAEDVARRLNMAAPVTLPRSQTKHNAWRELLDRSNSPLAQALRLLPGQLSASAKSILLAGLGQRTDASTIATNLAAAYAEEGRRVLLVDANIDQPRLSKLIDVEVVTGLQKVIQNNAKLDGALLATPIPGVSLLGAEADNTSPLDPNGFVQLLEQLEQRFDVVIVDLVEPLRHSIAPRLINAVDETLLVAHPSAVTERTLQPYSTWLQQKMPNHKLTLVVYSGSAQAGAAEGPEVSTPVIVQQAQSKG